MQMYTVHVYSIVRSNELKYITFTFCSTGVTYNIPVTIWLRPNHPYVPPMVYVTPTRDMGIQQSQFVDANGVVYLPYLNEWKVVSDSLHV